MGHFPYMFASLNLPYPISVFQPGTRWWFAHCTQITRSCRSLLKKLFQNKFSPNPLSELWSKNFEWNRTECREEINFDRCFLGVDFALAAVLFFIICHLVDDFIFVPTSSVMIEYCRRLT